MARIKTGKVKPYPKKCHHCKNDIKSDGSESCSIMVCNKKLSLESNVYCLKCSSLIYRAVLAHRMWYDAPRLEEGLGEIKKLKSSLKKNLKKW